MKNRLKELREKERYTQTKLAKLAGISRSQLIQIENGESKPKIDTALNISAVLGYKVDEIFLSDLSYKSYKVKKQHT